MSESEIVEGDSLRLIEIFNSVQGETSFTGLPTTFVRLAACNLRCSWCDTTYSFGRGIKHSLEEIVARVNGYGHSHVCITGGEPLLQKNVYRLMAELCDRGYVLSLETGGSLPIEEVDPRVHMILDVKCPGSGMEAHNLFSNLPLLKQKDEVKFVIKDRADYDYAKGICAEYLLFVNKISVLFSPVFGEMDSQILVGWILEDKLPVRLNLQIHKFIWHPQTKGV
jgi:7-carboxy-7-deazaguanine synthase